MTYDEFRLWKHQQKLAKKQRKADQPTFRTYGEYRRWKQEKKTSKTQAKRHQRQERHSAKHAEQQAKADVKPRLTEKYELFQHSDPTPKTEEKFQHPIR